MISLNKKSSLRIGRGHESEIRIPDISVSRFHALITFHDSNFYLEDNTSKFGTLIEVTDETPVTEEMLL
jgi:pSer/pThr/pTyr-binding forkhead associated (FHA) protein